jgi:hypothetical protein
LYALIAFSLLLLSPVEGCCQCDRLGTLIVIIVILN